MGGNAAWGTVHAGLTDPHTATGLVVLGGAAAGFLGRSDYAANDFDDGAFQAAGFIGSIIGAVIALLVYRAITSRRAVGRI